MMLFIRPLFTSELKRTLPSNLWLCGIALVGLFLIERIGLRAGMDTETAKVGATGCAIAFAFGAPFLIGAKAFGQVKDNYSSFLLSLPAARQSSWATIAIANLLNSILISTIVAVLGISAPGTEITTENLVWVALLYFALFFLGSCSVLLFKRAAAVAVGGFLIPIVGVAFGVILEGHLGTDGGGSFGFAILGFLLCLLFFGSLKAFVRAEFNDIRVRMKNLGLLTLCFVVFASAVITIINRDIPAAWGNWGDEISSAAASDDGRDIAVLSAHRQYPVYKRVEVIDIATGRVTATFVGQGLRQPVWSQDGRVLNLLATPLKPSNSLVRISRDGHKLEEWRAPFYTTLYTVRRTEGDLRIDGRGWETNVVVKTGDSSGAFDITSTISIQELDSFVNRLRYAVGSLTIPSDAEVHQEMMKRFPLPVDNGWTGAYMFSRELYEDRSSPGLYIRADSKEKRVAVLIYRGGSGWKTIADDIAVTDAALKRISGSNGLFQEWSALGGDVAVELAGRVIAYRNAKTGASVHVYNADRDSVITLGQQGDPKSEPGKIRIWNFRASDVRLISFYGKTGFLYFPTTNAFKKLTLLSGPVLLSVDDAGNQIYQDGRVQILYVEPDGRTRRLWPTSDPKS